MPTFLGRRFPPALSYYPTHMSPEDYQLFKRWSIQTFRTAINLYYDVGLGEGAPGGNELDPAMLKMWQKVTQKRADVVIEYEDKVEIVELRFNATSNAIGRLLSYRMLWEDAPAIMKPTSFVLVTNRYDADLERLAGMHDIQYLIV